MRKPSLDPLLRTSALLLLTFAFGCAAYGTEILEEFCNSHGGQLWTYNTVCIVQFDIGSKELSPKEVEEECEKFSPMHLANAINMKGFRKIECIYVQIHKCEEPMDNRTKVFLVKSTCVASLPRVDPATYNEAVEICGKMGASVLQPNKTVLAFTLDFLSRHDSMLESLWFGPPSTSANGKEYASVLYRQTRSFSIPSVFAERAETKEKHGVLCSFDAERHYESLQYGERRVGPDAHCHLHAYFVDNECKCLGRLRNSGQGFKGQYCEPCEYNLVPLHVNILLDFTYESWLYNDKNFSSKWEMDANRFEAFVNANTSMKLISYGNTNETDSFNTLDQDELEFGERWREFFQHNTGEPPKGLNNVDEAINRATAACNENNGKKCITLLVSNTKSFTNGCNKANQCARFPSWSSPDNQMRATIREATDKLRATGSATWVNAEITGYKDEFVDFATTEDVMKRDGVSRLIDEYCDHSFD